MNARHNPNTGSRRKHRKPGALSCARRRGVVLVGVLAFMVVLTGVLMDFTYRTKTHLNIVENRLDSARTRLAAESAADIVKAMLSLSIDMNDSILDDLFSPGRDIEVDGVTLHVRLEAESAKININNLAGGRVGRNFRRDVQMLFNLADVLNDEYYDPVLTYDMILSIIEWITPEDTMEVVIGAFPGEPAGSRYYRNLTPPYECKHARLNTLSELLLVKGITEEVLYGRAGDAEEPYRPGLADFMTLYGNSSGIRAALRREGITVADIVDVEPAAMETYLTIDVRAARGNARRRLRVIVEKNGPRVTERCREERKDALHMF